MRSVFDDGCDKVNPLYANRVWRTTVQENVSFAKAPYKRLQGMSRPSYFSSQK